MTFVYPNGERRFRSSLLDWAAADVRLLLVMANSTAGATPAADFVSDIVTLDECNAAGYARTAITGRSVDVDTVNKVVALLAAQTDLPAFAAGSRPNIGAVIYEHVGADSANPVLMYIDAAPYFPFQAVGSPVRFLWNATGIVRYPLTAV
jgi:hypothetical protein